MEQSVLVSPPSILEESLLGNRGGRVSPTATGNLRWRRLRLCALSPRRWWPTCQSRRPSPHGATSGADCQSCSSLNCGALCIGLLRPLFYTVAPHDCVLSDLACLCLVPHGILQVPRDGRGAQPSSCSTTDGYGHRHQLRTPLGCWRCFALGVG